MPREWIKRRRVGAGRRSALLATPCHAAAPRIGNRKRQDQPPCCACHSLPSHTLGQRGWGRAVRTPVLCCCWWAWGSIGFAALKLAQSATLVAQLQRCRATPLAPHTRPTQVGNVLGTGFAKLRS